MLATPDLVVNAVRGIRRRPLTHVPTAAAIAVAATNYLLARPAPSTPFAGLDLGADQCWQHLEDTIERLIVCASQPTGSSTS